MELLTTQLMDYNQAFVRLDGYARAVEVNGNTQVVLESYDLSPTVKWYVAINRALMEPFVKACEAQKKKAQDDFDKFVTSIDPTMDAKESNVLIAAKMAENNATLAELSAQKVEIPGLRKLPGDGIRIRARDPGIIALLTVLKDVFIEGEPNYGQPKKPALPKDD